MDFRSKLLISVILISSLHLLTCTGDDRIPAGSSISGNETIVSAGENYALGFYNPPNSSNWYVAIWFYKIPVQTVAWVANRETPLPDSAGKLSVTADGNLEIANADGITIWSANITASGGNRTAILRDTGNLAMTEPNGKTVWQSFDWPTATMLSGMQFYLNVKTNTSRRTVSWKSATDPSPGEFSLGIDPRTPRQLHVLRGSTTYWRENTWFKELSATKPEADRDYFVYLSTMANDNEVYYTFTVSSEAVFVRYLLTPVGHVELQAWRNDTQKWKVMWSSQLSKCDSYGRCGPFASCDYNSSQAACGCLEGFVPRVQREWDAGNWSSGCVRRAALQCGGGGGSGADGFLQLLRTKMPDFSISVGNISVADCGQKCSRNCSCAAYAYTNISGWRSSNCLIWVENLTDVVSNFGKTVIFLRLASSELGTGPSHRRRLVAQTANRSNGRPFGQRDIQARELAAAAIFEMGHVNCFLLLSMRASGRISTVLLRTNITNTANSPSDDEKNLLRILIPTIIGGTLFLSAFGFLLRQRIKRTGFLFSLFLAKAFVFSQLIWYYNDGRFRLIYAETGMRKNEHETDMTAAVFATGEGGSELPLFTYRSIVSATDNFSTANKLGEGGFGPVYKGRLAEGHEVAVKRLSKSSGQGIEELRNEGHVGVRSASSKQR
ncbi:hypothetical protein ACLOJK_020499 [Asimina triloba]